MENEDSVSVTLLKREWHMIEAVLWVETGRLQIPDKHYAAALEPLRARIASAIGLEN